MFAYMIFHIWKHGKLHIQTGMLNIMAGKKKKNIIQLNQLDLASWTATKVRCRGW